MFLPVFFCRHRLNVHPRLLATRASNTRFCGGLPCPDDNNNPFGYKFSWSPRGVLLAAVREAKYIEDGENKQMDATPGEFFHLLCDTSV